MYIDDDIRRLWVAASINMRINGPTARAGEWRQSHLYYRTACMLLHASYYTYDDIMDQYITWWRQWLQLGDVYIIKRSSAVLGGIYIVGNTYYNNAVLIYYIYNYIYRSSGLNAGNLSCRRLTSDHHTNNPHSTAPPTNRIKTLWWWRRRRRMKTTQQHRQYIYRIIDVENWMTLY